MSARTAQVGLECGYRGWHCAPGARAVVLAHRDDADCLGAALPSASKGKGKVELESPGLSLYRERRAGGC